MKVVIAGGGVAGLSIGWRLMQAGCAVTVVERDAAARSATWAAAGMLSPGAEVGLLEAAQVAFGREARAHWPAFAREIEEASGRSIAFREGGALVVAHDEAGAFRLAEECSALNTVGVDAEWLDARAAHEAEPLLAPHVLGALFARGDADVDNRAMGEALTIAFRRAGGELIEHIAVQSVLVEQGRAVGLMTARGAMRADAVVVALGAWSSTLGGVPDGVLPPVRPAKGQLVSFAPPKGAAIPRHDTGDHRVYMVPRNGRVIVGATVEDAGFDISVSDVAKRELVASAARIVPAAAEWPVVESWAGLRPRSADDAPVLGETALSDLFVASGQFRNGILFAPVIAEALSLMVQGKDVPFAVAAFDPRRFAGSS